jgi:hypothetical protein
MKLIKLSETTIYDIDTVTKYDRGKETLTCNKPVDNDNNPKWLIFYDKEAKYLWEVLNDELDTDKTWDDEE